EFVDVHQELDMPAVRLDAPCQTLERGHIEENLSFGNVDEVDAHTASSCFMHALDFGIGDVVFDDGNTTAGSAQLRHRVQHHQIVQTVYARLHQNGALDAKCRQ